MIFALALFCCTQNPETCPDGQGEPVAVLDVLGAADACGSFALAVGDHAYLDLPLSQVDIDCTEAISGAVELPYDPIYSNFGDTGPKFTYDIEAVEAGEGSLDISCPDGTSWMAWFTVE